MKGPFVSGNKGSVSTSVMPPLPNGDELRDGWYLIDKFGQNPLIDTTTPPVDIWDGPSLGAPTIYPFDLVPIVSPKISSSNIGDTGILRIRGLNVVAGEWVPFTENVQMNGQTQVSPTTPNIIRINRMQYRSGTSNVGNLGNICFYTGLSAGGVPATPANIRAVVRIAKGQTLMAIYTMPDGYNSYLMMYDMNLGRASVSGTKEGDVELLFKENGQGFNMLKSHTLGNTGTAYISKVYDLYLTFSAKADIVVRATSILANSTQIDAGFTILHNPLP